MTKKQDEGRDRRNRGLDNEEYDMLKKRLDPRYEVQKSKPGAPSDWKYRKREWARKLGI